MKRAQGHTHLPFIMCASWGLGEAGLALLAVTTGALLLRFMTDYLGVAAGAAGLLIAGSKVYDALADPIIGAVSDRVRSRIGRRRPFLMAAAGLGPLALIALFAPPALGTTALTAWMLASLALYSTAYATWQVPHVAMAMEFTDDYGERSRLSAFRFYGGLIGQTFAAVCGPWLLSRLGGGRAAYGIMAVTLAAVLLVLNLITIIGTRHAPFRVRGEAFGRTGHGAIRLVLMDPPMLIALSLVGLIQMSTAASFSNFAFFVRYWLHTSEAWIGGLFILISIGAAVSIPVWLRAGRGREKRSMLAAAYILLAVVFASWFAAGPGEPNVLIGARILLQGVAVGGIGVYLQSMFMDCVHHHCRLSGQTSEGSFSGLMSFVDKGSQALGIAAVGIALSLGGYVASVHGRTAIQPGNAVMAVRLLYALTPLASALISLGLLSFYRLNQAELERHVV